ncbi:MAG TPA: 2OG-Fe(II) oxygenase, partial [Thermoleophilaceae bacterium]
SRDYVFGDKHELSSVEEQGAAARAVVDAVLGDDFRRFLSSLARRELFVDPAFHGGGFHQGGDGSFLDPHVDFNVHPLHPDWLRVLNVLLYLNRDWRPEYGGSLELRNGLTGETGAVEPLFNRAVVMLTADHTYHGYPRMSLPPGVTRKSVAVYAYQLVPANSVRARTTGWAPDDAGWAKRLLARRYDTLVRVKTRVAGSATAKNR